MLGGVIGARFQDDHGRGGPGAWWSLCDFDVQFEKHTILRPDLVGWRRESSPKPPVRPAALRPDWVCEVVSRSNTSHDRVTKRPLYTTHNITYYWVVDPIARTLDAWALCDGAWVEIGVYDEDDVARIAPFDAVELEVGRSFAPPEEGVGEGAAEEQHRGEAFVSP